MYNKIALFIGFMITSFALVAQQVILTGIVDGTLTGAKPRAIELYINGTVDLSNYVLNRENQASGQQSLSGTYTNAFVYVIANNSEAEFDAVFGSNGDFSNRIISSSINWNGDDAFQILLNGTVIDEMGVSGTANYRDSYLYRNDNTGPDGGWIASNWQIPGNDILDNNTAAQHGSTVPFGTYIIGSPTPAVTVRSNATPAEPSTNGSFQLTLNETPASDVTVTYSLTGTAQENTDYTDASAGSVVISSGTTTADVVINIIDDNEEDANETIIITLQSANNGYATNNASATLTITDDETTAFVPIYTIQGSGTASPLVNQNVTTRGVVTATYFGTEQMGGFFIQDATGDGDTNTSDGIYVFCNSNDCQNLSVGDEITMDATVQEFFDATQLSNVSNVSVLSSRLMLPPPTIVTFDGSPINFEALEGMLVQYAGRLYVSDVFEAGRFGDITLSPNAPLTQPTQVIDPNDATASGTTTTGNSNAAAIATQTTLNANNQMVLSDGQTAENPTNLPFFFSTEGTVRIGSSVNELTGIIHYSFSEYRLEPLDDTHPLQSQTFDHVARPAVPNLSNADVVISAFNVLNYFNGDGQGGGFPTSRGASTFSEFQRQEAKIVAALNAMNADIVGLNELENDGTGSTSAIQQLVDALNAVAGANTYAFVDDSSVPHTSDQIRNGIIYQPARVTPIGTPFTSSGTVYSRKPVAQRFRINADNTEIIYIINHFKSKGCGGAAGADADQNDGQACYNDRRRNQALDLMSFINSLGADEKIIAMGDYNSYFEEDPVDVLRAGGMQVLNQSEDVSFVFFGQGGTLDFAFANDNFNSLVSDFESWNINAEEPRALDYNDFNQAALYKADPFRSSDHNPVLIGMRSSSSLPISWVEFEAVATHKTTALSWTTDGQKSAGQHELYWSTDTHNWQLLSTQKALADERSQHYTFVHTQPQIGNNYYQVRFVDETGDRVNTPIRTVVHHEDTDILLYPNPVSEHLHLDIPTDLSIGAYTLVRITDSRGRIVQTVNWQKDTAIDISALPIGTFYIQIRNGAWQSLGRFIKH